MGALLEGEDGRENLNVRDEIIDRVGTIFDLLIEEFNDNDVTSVLAEAYEPLLDSWTGGRLDEDVMEHDDFIAEVKPVVALITKSLDRIDREDRGELGN